MARRNQAIDRHLGARVRLARIERKISQTVLGEHLGISFQQVQKYELGKDRISASQLVSIARTLGKEMAFFFEDLGDAEDDGRVDAMRETSMAKLPRTTTAYDIKIIRMLHAIDDERVKMKLYGLMEAIVGSRSHDEEPAVRAPLDEPFGDALRQ